MTRQVVLDTETTGLDVARNHRLIEIGCVELISGRRSSEIYHSYVNPTRSISEGAKQVHGITEEQLRHEPKFDAVAKSFLDFIADAELIIHNAEFDLAFINMELARIQNPPLKNNVIDSLIVARKKFPNQSNTLDALCRRFGIDLSSRGKHSALLDATLLAEVYIALTSPQQAGFGLDSQATPPKHDEKPTHAQASNPNPLSSKPTPAPAAATATAPAAPAPSPARARLSQQEIEAHQQALKKIKTPLWKEFGIT